MLNIKDQVHLWRVYKIKIQKLPSKKEISCNNRWSRMKDHFVQCPTDNHWYPVGIVSGTNSGITHVLRPQMLQFKVLALHPHSKIWGHLQISIPSDCTSLLLEAMWNLIAQEGEGFFIYSVAFDLFMPFSHSNFVVTVLSIKFFNCFISVRVVKGQQFCKRNLINISFSGIHVAKSWDLEALKLLRGLN